MSSKSDRPSTPPSSSPEPDLKELGEDIGKKMYEWGQINEDIRALSIGNSFVEDDEKINQQKTKIQNTLHALFESFFTETEEVKERIDTKKKEYLKVYGQFYDQGETQLNKQLEPIKAEIKKLLDIANYLSGEIGKILASLIAFYKDSQYQQCLTEIIANELETTADSIKGKNCSQKSLERIVFRKIAPSGTEMYSGDDTTKSMGIRSLGVAISDLVREVMSSDHATPPVEEEEEQFGERTSPGMRLADFLKKDSDGHDLPEDDGDDEEVTQVSYRPGIEGAKPEIAGRRRSRLSRKERKKANKIRGKGKSKGASQGTAQEQSPTSTLRPGTVAELFAHAQPVRVIPSTGAQESAPAPESESAPASQQELHIEEADDDLTDAVIIQAQEFYDNGSDDGEQDGNDLTDEEEEDLGQTMVFVPQTPKSEPEPEQTQTPIPEPTPTPIPEPTPTPIPEPIPEPTPTPISEPVPEPTPTPISEPVPEPTPTPISEPVPEPTPTPIPEPVPEPTPTPIPEPTPTPIPEPTPTPIPEPTPTPIPEPTPTPTPEPTPTPVPTPISSNPPPPQPMAEEAKVTTPSPWLAERKPKHPTTHGGVPIPITKPLTTHGGIQIPIATPKPESELPAPTPVPEHISTATRNGVLATAGIALVAIAGLVLAPTMAKECSSQTDTTAGDTSASTTGTTGSTTSESEEPTPEAKQPTEKENLSGKVTIDTEHDAFKAYKARIARAKTHASHMTKIAQSTEFNFDGTETANQKKMIILQEMINRGDFKPNGHFKYNKFTRASLKSYQRSLNLLKAEIEKGDVDVDSENFADAKRYTEIRMLMNAIQYTVNLKKPADVEGYTVSKSRVDNPAYWAFQKYEKQVPGLYACGTQALEEIDQQPLERKDRGYVVKTFFDKVEACGEARRAVNPHDGTTSISRSVRTRAENGKSDVMGRMLWELDAVKKTGTKADPDPTQTPKSNDPSNGKTRKPSDSTDKPADSNPAPIHSKVFNNDTKVYAGYLLDDPEVNLNKQTEDLIRELIGNKRRKEEKKKCIELTDDDIFEVSGNNNHGQYGAMAKMWNMKRKAETRRPLPPPVPKRKVENKHTTYSQMHKLFMASQTNNTETPEPTYTPTPIIPPRVTAQPAPKYAPKPAPSPVKKKSLWERAKSVFAKAEPTPEQIEREELQKTIPKKGFFRSLWS